MGRSSTIATGQAVSSRALDAKEERPADQIALEALSRLHAARLVEKHEFEEFYVRISDIIRIYLEQRFQLRAPEMTTEEFLAELRESDALEARFRPLLEEFLRSCDLVKFAEFQPTTDDIQKMFDTTKEFIQATQTTE